jgi:hypothetical protein
MIIIGRLNPENNFVVTIMNKTKIILFIFSKYFLNFQMELEKNDTKVEAGPNKNSNNILKIVRHELKLQIRFHSIQHTRSVTPK